jgi:predicted 2-oxoglutarate/Fe(II)-dependent dioxygenase YbiX
MYYPLAKNTTYVPVLCVEGIITTDDLHRINEQIKTTNISAAIVGEHLPQSAEEFETLRVDAHKIRKSNVSFLDMSEWSWLYEKLCAAVNQANIINFNKLLYGLEPLQYTEYDSKYSGFYGPHKDSHEFNIQNGLVRSLSFSLQLSDPDDYTGGDLKIYHDNNVYIANKKIGCINFFDSNLLHEVTPVNSGFRKSLVGWVIGPRV